jgi:hypothetical protein
LQASTHCLEPSDWTLTIADNDTNVAGTFQWSTSLQSVAENGGPVTVTITRTAGTLAGIEVFYETGDIEALHTLDYGFASGSVVFGLNELSKSFQLQILNDPWDEQAFETFSVGISQVSGGSIGSPANEVVRILDNDGDTGIFGDGFERGDTDAWFATVPSG